MTARRFLPTLLAGLFWSAAPAVAATVSATYDVRFAGIRIATAQVNSTIAGGDYSMDLTTRYNVLLYSGTITGRVSGRLVGDRLQPRDYSLASSGEPERRSAITFDGGNARRIVIEPPLEPDWNEGRVILRPQHQRGVLDPLSGFVYAALRAGSDEANACRTTVPVFSGVSRFDVALSPAEPRPAQAGGRAPRGPDVVSCRIRFVPIAGHRPANATIRALQSASAMRIEFERATSGPARLPHRIVIPTRYGTVSIQRQS